MGNARNHAIVIGAQAYANLNRLSDAVADAVAVRSFMRDQGFETAELLRDPGFADVNDCLNNWERDKKLSENDTVWFYFAGHGCELEERDLLIPVDAPEPNLTSFSAQCIPVERVIKTLLNTNAGKIVMIVDACRNGGPEGARLFGDRTMRKANDQNVVVFFSCSAGEVSYEKDGHGVFTWGFLDAMRDGTCRTVLEFDDYLRKRVPECSKELALPVQTPNTNASDLQAANAILCGWNHGGRESFSDCGDISRAEIDSVLRALLHGELTVSDEKADQAFDQTRPGQDPPQNMRPGFHFYTIVRDLACQPHRPPENMPLLEFLIRCDSQLQLSPAYTEYRAQLERILTRFKMTIDAIEKLVQKADKGQEGAVPELILKIDASGSQFPSVFGWLRHLGRVEPLSDLKPCQTREQLEREISAIVVRAYSQLTAWDVEVKTLRVSAIVRIPQLVQNLHSIVVGRQGRRKRALGRRHPFWLRTWERSYLKLSEYSDAEPVLKRLWRTLGNQPLSNDSVSVWECEMDDAKLDDLEDKDIFVLVCPDLRSSGEAALKCGIQCDIPAICWLDELPEGVDELAAEKQLARLLGHGCPNELGNHATSFRNGSLNENDSNEAVNLMRKLGDRLSLLLDSPEFFTPDLDIFDDESMST